MESRLLMLAFFLGLTAAAASAHGTKVHVSGTVEKINADSLQVKTREGKTVEVKLVASTVYLLHVTEKQAKPSDASTDKPAKVADLAVGDLVVIHATPKGSMLEADEVKFSVPGASKAASATQKPKS
ncbi:MAG: hypothetical protein DMG35_05215 [Acidobacteria bacterium]|nr:MAG: hypothetical protein AUH86_10820 [Acidobacteria bacterium 13_1_40CM_4_58_4]PYT63140.1 MAG: hypothetical protein DMG35_05215 [Acidobacteriota bacterium]